MILTCSNSRFSDCPALRWHYLVVAGQAAVLSLGLLRRCVIIRFLIVTAVAALLSSPYETMAGVVYEQTSPAEPSGAFSSQDTTSGQAVADNFLLTGTKPVQVRSIRLIGVGTGDPATQPQDDFRILFFQRDGGTPGLSVPGGDFDGGLLTIRAPTGGMAINGSFEPIEYRIDLGSGVSLQPGTEYWVAVTNDPGVGFGWGWARAEGVFDSNTAGTADSFTSPSWTIFQNGGMWFELNDHNIPEPSTLTFLLIGLFAAAGYGGTL